MLWARIVVTLTLPCRCPACCPMGYYPHHSLGFRTNSSAKFASVGNLNPEMCRDVQRCKDACKWCRTHDAATLFIGKCFQESTLKCNLNGMYLMNASSSIRSNCSAPILRQDCVKGSKDSRLFRSVYIEKFWYENVGTMPWTSRPKNQYSDSPR